MCWNLALYSEYLFSSRDHECLYKYEELINYYFRWFFEELKKNCLIRKVGYSSGVRDYVIILENEELIDWQNLTGKTNHISINL